MFTDSMLMSPDFDEEGYLRYALHASNCKTEQVRLAACSAAVREEMHNILTENMEDMLQQVTATSSAQRDAAAVRQAAATLMHSTSRLRHTIEEPYHVIQGNITKLQNTNATLNTLRGIMKFISLTTRLRSFLPDDIVRAARTMHEVEELLQTVDIAGIDVVRARMDVVDKSATAIRSKAQDMLRRADSRDPADVTTALQCFVSMGSVSRVLGSFMTDQKREVMKVLMRDLDLQTITDEISRDSGGNADDSSGPNSRVCEVLSSHLRAALDSTVKHTSVVIAVWRVLAKKADPVTRVPYLSSIENPAAMLRDYWHFITDKLRERLQAIQKRPALFFALANDVLRFRSLFISFLENVKELLELLDRTMELETCSAGRLNAVGCVSSGALPRSGVEQLKCTWLAQMTREVNERFAAHVMDRHRERLHGIISRLHSITPGGGGRPFPSLSVDPQRPYVPACVHVLDVRSYATLAMQDAMEYQRDPETLSTVLSCMLQCLVGFIEPVAEVTAKWPLPPLPSVSSEVNTVQMLHICICNACTHLSIDFAVMLASLPQGEEEDQGELMGESVVSAQKLVVERHRKLLEVTTRLKNMSEQTVSRFFRSVSVLLLDSVSMCVDGPCGQEAAGVSQLQSQMRHFMAHYYYLFDPQTPTLGDNARRITDSLIARLIVAVSVAHPLTKEVQEHLVICLNQVPQVVTSFGPNTQGAVGRSTMVLKGQLHQLCLWYNTAEYSLVSPEGLNDTALVTLPLVVFRLLLLQRVLHPSAAVESPAAAMGITSECFIEIVEAAVLEELVARMVPESESAGHGTRSSQTVAKFPELMVAVEQCFRRATEELCGDAAQEATVQWVKHLWEKRAICETDQ